MARVDARIFEATCFSSLPNVLSAARKDDEAQKRKGRDVMRPILVAMLALQAPDGTQTF